MSAFDGQVVLVTGSSRGIGAAIAAEFARRGASVAVHGRDRAAVGEVSAAIRGHGGRAIGVAGDLTDFAQAEAVRGQVEAEAGPVDGWRAAVDGNLLVPFLTLKSFLPGMKQRRRGCVITIGSAAGRRADPRSPIPYAAAKAGLALLTQQVAVQAGPFGIRVNRIAPETILTERNRERIPPGQQAALAGGHPLQRLGTPDDVASAAAFLASADAAWITGVVVDVAGGAVLV